jgi:hypothetical protein
MCRGQYHCRGPTGGDVAGERERGPGGLRALANSGVDTFSVYRADDIEWRTMRARRQGKEAGQAYLVAAGGCCSLYLLARRFARPFAALPLPRARAAFPLAPAERLPVNLENASSIRPADLSTKPSALSRRPDFIALLSPSCLELTHLFPRDDRTNQYAVWAASGANTEKPLRIEIYPES